MSNPYDSGKGGFPELKALCRKCKTSGSIDCPECLDRARFKAYRDEIARLKAELDKERKRYDSVQQFIAAYHDYVRQNHPLDWAVDPGNVALTINNIIESNVKDANADADLLGREVAAWREAYKAWSEPGELHFGEPFESVANTDARPTAAARVKGTP